MNAVSDERSGRTGRVPVLLVIVLLLVLGAFGLLVIALVSGHTDWAWGSVAASAVAGVLLVTDWIVRPAATAEPAAVPAVQAPVMPADWAAAEPAASAPADQATLDPVGPVDRAAPEPATSVLAEQATVEPVNPLAGGDTSRANEGDTPQAPAAERMGASTRRTGASEHGFPRRPSVDPPSPPGDEPPQGRDS